MIHLEKIFINISAVLPYVLSTIENTLLLFVVKPADASVKAHWNTCFYFVNISLDGKDPLIN